MIALKLLVVATIAGSLITAHPQPTPAPELEQRAIDCANISGALSVLKKVGPPATSFCFSFLKIPTTKVITTQIVATTTSTTSKTTTMVISQSCPARKRNAHIDHRGLEEANLDGTPVYDVEKRNNNNNNNILPLLAAFAAAKVSEGCSCLNLQPKATSTTTLTTSTTTVKVLATLIVCETPAPVCIALGELCPYGATPNPCCAGKCTGIVSDTDPAICFISSSGN